MANVAHSTLTGADLHEPKGIEGATAGQVYAADGVGSGAWSSLAASGGLLAYTKITASNAAWVPNALTTKIVVRCVGGGGGGGASDTSVSAPMLAATGGGCGSESWGYTASIAASYNVTVGAGGASANVGGDTSFGTVATAAGGRAGQSASSLAGTMIPGHGEAKDGIGGTGPSTAGNGLAAAANTGAGGGGAYGSALGTNTGGAGGSGVVQVWEYA